MYSPSVRRVAFWSVLLHTAECMPQKLVLYDMLAKFAYHLVRRILS